MVRVTVELTDDEAAALQQAAAQRGLASEELVREAVEALLHHDEPAPATAELTRYTDVQVLPARRTGAVALRVAKQALPAIAVACVDLAVRALTDRATAPPQRRATAAPAGRPADVVVALGRDVTAASITVLRRPSAS